MPEIDTSDPTINVIETVILRAPKELLITENSESEKAFDSTFYFDLDTQVSRSLRRLFKTEPDSDQEEEKSL